MQPREAAEQDNNRRREDPRLNDRYGKIGIEAVAAAVRCRNEERKVERRPTEQHESD
jgi:hypothetical protein